MAVVEYGLKKTRAKADSSTADPLHALCFFDLCGTNKDAILCLS